MTKWNNDKLSYEMEHVEPGQWIKTMREWLERTRGSVADDFDNPKSSKLAMLHVVMDEWLQYKYQRPRWYIDAEMLALLDTLEVASEDLRGVFIPWDALTLVFPEGTAIAGIPTKFIRMHCIRSKISQKMLGEFVPELGDKDLSGDIFVRCCSSLSKREVEGWGSTTTAWPEETGEMEGAREGEGLDMAISGVRSVAQDDNNYSLLDPRSAAWVRHCIKIMTVAWLYNAARPEFVKPFTLPRSERFQVRERGRSFRIELPKRMLRPGVKWIGGNNDGEGVGSPKAHHFRGFVLRTLRHARYARRPDGTFRVILVPPCEIHPELAEPVANLSRTA